MLRWKFILIPATVGLLEVVLFGRELQITLAPWVNLAITFLFWPAIFAVWSANKLAERALFHGFVAGFFYNLVAASIWTALVYVENPAELRASLPQDYGPVLALILLVFSIIATSIWVGLCCSFFTWIVGRITKSTKAMHSNPQL